MPVRDISLAMVLKVLEPIWSSKTETATRLRGRIESIIDWAIARGYRTDSNPARWKGLLDKLLPAPGKVTRRRIFRRCPMRSCQYSWSNWWGRRDGCQGPAIPDPDGSPLRRSSRCHLGEIDLAARVWTIPAERMKASKAHRVPLSDAAIALLQEMKALASQQDAPRAKRMYSRAPTAVTLNWVAALGHDAHGGTPSPEAGGSAPWVPLYVPRLVRGADRLPERGRGNGTGPCGGQQGGGSVSAW